MLRRRTFLQAAAAATIIGSPSITRAASQSTLRFIPVIDLAFLDPVATTAQVSRTHGYMVFDTLYGMGKNLEVSPQMVEGHTVEEDGKLWTLTLRDGLFWHDGEKVLARDCVASIRRWAARDTYGSSLKQVTAYSDEVARPFRDHVAHHSGMMSPALSSAAGSGFSVTSSLLGQSLNAVLRRVRRMLSPESSMRWALWTRRSRMASA